MSLLDKHNSLAYVIYDVFKIHGSKLDDLELDVYEIDNVFVDNFYYYRGFVGGLMIGQGTVPWFKKVKLA